MLQNLESREAAARKYGYPIYALKVGIQEDSVDYLADSHQLQS